MDISSLTWNPAGITWQIRLPAPPATETQRLMRHSKCGHSRKVVFALASVFLLSATFNARSATETWNPVGGGGDGTWDESTPNWNSGALWTDSNDALFSGTGGTVTVDAPFANSLTFSASGSYLLDGGILTLTGSDVTVNSNATIDSEIDSTVGLLVTGAATLTLTGIDNFGAAPVDVEFGTLAIQGAGTVSNNNGYIGNNAGSNGAVTVSGNGATWTINSDLYVGNSGTGTLLISAGGSVSNSDINIGATIGESAGSAGEVTVTGAGSSWTNTGDLFVGDSGSGTLVISAGGFVTNGDINIGATIGNNSGANGTVTVTGTGSSWTDGGDLFVGNSGTGTLFISAGGSVSNSQNNIGASIGQNAGSNGMVTVTGTGSMWTDNGDLFVGDSGTGTLLISAGGSVSNNDISIGATIGQNAGAAGTVTVTGTGSSWTNAGDLFVGDSGTGTLIISAGGIVTDNQNFIGATIGNNTKAAGTVTVTGSGSSWTDNGDLYVGDYGTGTLLISAGGTVASFASNIGATIGENAGATGTVTVTGTGSSWTGNGNLIVGDYGAGTLLISTSGSVNASGIAMIGNYAGASGTVTVTGIGSTWIDSGDLYVGDSGTGTLLVSAGGAVTNNENNIGATIGESAGSTGTVTVTGTGSSWTDNGDLFVGDYGTGTMVISAGGSVTDTENNVGAAIGQIAGSTGTVKVTGSGSTWTNNGDIVVGNSGTGTLLISAGGYVSNNNGSIGLSGGTGIVTVTGSNSTWFNSANISIGGTVPGEGAGLLSITNGGQVVGQGQTTVWTTGTLAFGENATLNSPLYVTGGKVTLVDGQVQSVTLSNYTEIDAGSSLDFDVGNGSDQIAFSTPGLLNVTGSATVNLYGISGLVTSGTDVLLGDNPSGLLSLGAVYSMGNFKYSLLSTATSEEVIVTAATPLTVAYWKGQNNNIWSVLLGSVADTNWTTTSLGNVDSHLTPSASTNVYFSAAGPANEGDTVLGVNMTIKSLTVSDTNPVVISGSNPNPFLAPSTLTIAGTSGTTGLTINSGAGLVTLGANVNLTGSSQNVVVENLAGLLVTGSVAGNFGLYVGGSSSGATGASLLQIANGGAISAAQSTVWNTGTLAFAGSGALSGSLTVNGGTVTLVDGELQTVTLTGLTTIAAGSNLDFEVGNGSDRIAFSGTGSLSVTGTGTVTLYGTSGITPGTDVLIAAATSGKLSLANVLYNSGNFTYALLSTSTSEDVIVTATSALTTAYWKGGQNNVWSILVGRTATNWTTNAAGTIDPNLTPSATTDVIFSANSPANEGNTVLGTNMTIKSLTFSGTNAVAISGSNTLGANTLTVSGTSGQTGITVNSGAGLVTIGANLWLSGSSQTITVNSASGMVDSGSIGANLGLTKSGTGTLTLTGSSIFPNGNVDVEAGNLTIQNGGSASAIDGVIGGNAGSNGMATVSGAGSTWTTSNTVFVGFSGTGALQIANHGTASSANGNIGENAGSSGAATVTGIGSTWIVSGGLSVGLSGSGTLLITNGGSVSSSTLSADGAVIGSGTAGSDIGMVTVTGAGSTWTEGGDLFVGDSGTGTLLITNGGAVSSGYSEIGNVSGGYGTVTVTGSGSTWTDSSEIYVDTYGTLQISNGGAVSTSFADIENDSTQGGGGMVTVTGTGSTLTDSGPLYLGGQVGVGSGLLRITNGGLASIGSTIVEPTGTLAFGENTTFNGPINIIGGTVTLVDGQVQTVTLTTPVTVSAGANLNFDVGNGSDEVIVSSSASTTLSGTGLINLYAISGQVTSGTDVIIAAKTSGTLSLGNVYNSGNFTYALAKTSTSEKVVVSAAASPLTVAYWKGGLKDVWSILVGGNNTDWTTDLLGTTDPHLTPSATTDVIFSADNDANEGDTVLGTSMTIKSLTINDPNPVSISGSDPNSWMGTDTLTISGSTGTTGINVASGAGQVTIAANVFLSGNSQTITVNNAAGLAISGSLGSSSGLTKAGTGTLTLTGWDVFAGATTVSGGTLNLGGTLVSTGSVSVINATLTLSASNAINNAARLTLNKGILNVQNNPLKIADLTITGTSTLDLGVSSSAAIINFAASNTDTWTGTLTIRDWNGNSGGGGLDQIFFGSNHLGLTSGQLADIFFLNPIINGASETGDFSANILNDGEIVAAVPEPGAWGLFASGIALLIGIRMRRRRSPHSSIGRAR